MAKPTKPDRPGAWVDAATLADVLDVSLTYCRREVLRCAKREHTREEGRKTLYKARPTIEAYLASQLQPRSEQYDYDPMLLEPFS